MGRQLSICKHKVITTWIYYLHLSALYRYVSAGLDAPPLPLCTVRGSITLSQVQLQHSTAQAGHAPTIAALTLCYCQPPCYGQPPTCLPFLLPSSLLFPASSAPPSPAHCPSLPSICRLPHPHPTPPGCPQQPATSPPQ